ncbi:GTPase IMAP family member 4-like [Ctenopharyngodon idella]|uniref:GTPase IMAP family member 4-like n=1 Tax=Ctenopharyngodon idella TaxID=7959 RepID=UPI002232BDDC|nr:GTPase IMAP family member 4-like [Ctenopharyngodon idella]XP_051752088.1 GTPase IMAP family member 4-like [Ctenopharyngodon idella]
MAAKMPSQGGSSVQSDLRIVIVGNAGDHKNKVVKSVLNCENPTGVKVGLCTLHQCEHEGIRISVVEAPGWDKVSKQTPKSIKKEVVRSVSLCPPGPHALLLVIPVKTLSKEPSTSEITAAQMHMELLSERIWKHTILLFACDDGLEEPQIKEHIRGSKKILEKCGGRSYVLQKSAWESPAQINELLKKIDNLVKENHGDFFIPQAELKHEVIPRKTKASGKSEIRHRRGSLDNPPTLNKDKGDSRERKETKEADKHTPLEDTPKIYMDVKQFVVILMAVVGALIGAVTGAQNGVSGSCMGIIFGVVVGILLASFSMYIYTPHIYSHSYLKKPTQRTS